MYTNIDLQKLYDEASQYVIDNDRRTFNDYFVRAVDWCERHGWILGGEVGLKTLLGNSVDENSPPDILDIFYESSTPFDDAKKFADAIGQKYTVLNTVLKNDEFEVFAETRRICKLKVLQVYKGVRASKVIEPATGQVYGKIVRLMPEDHYILETLQALYNPMKCGEWPNLIANWQQLHKSHLVKIGGAKEQLFQPRIIESLLQYVSDNGILIGSFALNSFGLTTKLDRLQMICDRPIEEMVKEIARAVGQQCKWVKFQTNLHSDWRLAKYTIYTSGEQNRPIMDIFNSTSYEIVPVTMRLDCPVAMPWVLMRFLYIDIWLLKTIQALGTNVGNKIGEMRAKIAALSDMVDDMEPEQLFDMSEIRGVYMDEILAKKRMLKEVKYKPAPYYVGR